jgi:hypothetical protein
MPLVRAKENRMNTSVLASPRRLDRRLVAIEMVRMTRKMGLTLEIWVVSVNYDEKKH